MHPSRLLVILCLVLAGPLFAQPPTGAISAADYDSLQAAVDANPGKMIFLPPGDYPISRKLRIATHDTGLWGFGRIVQTNPADTILEIEHARGVRIQDITLTRAEGAQDATAPGLFCWDSHDVVIDGVQVIDSRSRSAAIEVRDSTGCTVRDCRVLNYKCIAVDDRTSATPGNYGYAFWAIDGTGILVNGCRNCRVADNHIIEHRLFPTPELKAEYKLGSLTEGRYPTAAGGALEGGVVAAGYTSNWHQGSAILMTGPETTSHNSITGNHMVNAAQGIDLHCDQAVVSGNVIDHCLIGIKMTHGCRNLVVADNIITHVDLWGILVNPGAASHAAAPVEDDRPARPANVDAGIIISGNMITNYGRGNDYWNLGRRPGDLGSSFPIALLRPQLPSNPVLSDVLIQGNMVYDENRDGIIVDGQVRIEPPRYRYAVYLEPAPATEGQEPQYPRAVRFQGNILHPGEEGVCNVELGE